MVSGSAERAGARRLKWIHARFLESCRSLTDGNAYWRQSGLRKWLAQLITPVPLLALHDAGKNLYDALQWLELNCRSRPLDVDLVRQYHRMVCPAGTGSPGDYRKGPILVENSRHRRSPAGRVPSLMRLFDVTLREEQKRLEASDRADEASLIGTAVGLHQQLVMIHPFNDGNGRVARLLMNHFLRRYGAGYVILPSLANSHEHFLSLEEAHEGNPERLRRLALQCFHRI